MSGAAMSWKDRSNYTEAAETLAYDTVRGFLGRGMKGSAARHQAALALGITPRQCKSLLYREPIRFVRERYEAMQRRFIVHLDRQAEELEREAAQLRAAARQYAMEFACSQSSGPGSGNGGSDGRCAALDAADRAAAKFVTARAEIARRQMRGPR